MNKNVTLRDLCALLRHSEWEEVRVYDPCFPASRIVVNDYTPDELLRRSVAGLYMENRDGTAIILIALEDVPIDFEPGYRICSECGQAFVEGYCVADGFAYYCDDDCLHKHYTDEEWRQMYEEDEGYWTTWWDHASRQPT